MPDNGTAADHIEDLMEENGKLNERNAQLERTIWALMEILEEQRGEHIRTKKDRDYWKRQAAG